ncbi:MAG: hypothetical protein ACRCWC_06105, partial [Plesiomonas shigelloides]
NSLLSIAPIAAFGFLTDSPAAITTQDSQLAVPTGKTLAIIGGTLALSGSEPPIHDATTSLLNLNSRSWLLAESGRIYLASVAGAGEVSNEDGTLAAVGGSISLLNTALSTRYNDGGGNILVRGGVVNLNNSALDAITVDRQGGFISVIADTLNLQHSWIDTGSYGAGRSGDIALKTAQLTLDSTSEIVSDTHGQGEKVGDAGMIGIEVERLMSEGKISSTTYNAAAAGFLIINAQQLALENGALLSSESYGRGRAGNVVLSVSGLLSLHGQSSAGKNTLISSSAMNDTLEDAGAAGTVAIQADQVDMVDASILSSTLGNGHSGDITMVARQLKLTEGAQIASGTFSSGQSGSIRLTISEGLTVAGYNSIGIVSGIYANSENQTLAKAGNAGDIHIQAGQVQLLDGGNINSATYGSGQGGTVALEVAGALLLRGQTAQNNPSIIGASTTSMRDDIVAGDAGYIVIQAGEVRLDDRTLISSDTFGAGRAGNIALTAQQLELNGTGMIGSRTYGSGQSGNIQLQIADTLTVSGRPGADVNELKGIFASSENATLATAGNAGNIYIEAGQVRLLNGGRIDTATLGSGQGGNIELHTSLLS